MPVKNVHDRTVLVIENRKLLLLEQAFWQGLLWSHFWGAVFVCLRKYWSIVCAGDISAKRGVWDRLWAGGSNPRTCYAGEDRRSATSHCADQQNGWPHSQLGCGKVAYVKIKTVTVFMLNEQECNSQSFRAPKCCTILLWTTAAHSWDHKLPVWNRHLWALKLWQLRQFLMIS